MNSFTKAFEKESNKTTTTNGMTTKLSSLNKCVDFFGNAGSKRGQNITAMFEHAFIEDKETALKLMLWLRDVRGGSGERELFRSLLPYIEQNLTKTQLEVLIPLIPEYGRWDDILHFTTIQNKTIAYTTISKALLIDKNTTCAKWMVRPGKKNSHIAKELMKFMKLTPKQYRHLLSGLTEVVENKLCARQFDEIEYQKLPSLAHKRYTKAFEKHDEAGYTLYKESLAKGESTINAGAIAPYQVSKMVYAQGADDRISNAMFDALPDYIGNANIIPIIDTSGSMNTDISNNVTAMDVAISLGTYVSLKNKSEQFGRLWINFSTEPKLKVFDKKHSYANIVRYMYHDNDWGGSTNIQKTFELILNMAVSNKVKQKDMPKSLIIFSDMQFNESDRQGETALKMAKRLYKDAGYKMPKLIFWNLDNRSKTESPVKFDKEGTALVSGFTPALMKAILSDNLESFTPINVMNEALLKYDPVVKTILSN